MYEAYYRLRERPFDLTPNPRYLLMTSSHREALSTIQYGLNGRKGITLLLGPAGTGKTTLVHAALEHPHENVKVLCLTNPMLSREEFFEFLTIEFGLDDALAKSKTQVLVELRRILRERREAGGFTALIIDEAQAMSYALLEEVRLLTNLETSTEQLLSIVMVGQAELAERLNEPKLYQLKQRIALRSKLSPLTAQEAAAYIAERIRIAGGDVASIFTRDAIAAIYECSRGIPRTISVICDNALVSGFAVDQRPVGRAIIAEVSRDFDFAPPGRQTSTAGEAAPVAVRVETEAADPAKLRPVSHRLLAPAVPLGQHALPDEGTVPANAGGSVRRGFFSLFARTANR
jgi:general secretion pathway protein A